MTQSLTPGSAAYWAAERAVRTEHEYVSCPECGLPAMVEWRTEVGSTTGAVEHVKIRCVDRHWFLMPAERLTG
jgi:hypothetical protein